MAGVADQHVWGHWRAAMRELYAYEKGRGYTNGQGSGGKKAEDGDFRRLRRVLRGNLELGEGQLELLVEVAMGIVPQRSAPALDALCKRVEYNLRKMHMVPKSNTVPTMRRDSWQDAEGNRLDSTSIVDSS